MSNNRLYGDLSGFYDVMCAEINYAEQCEAALRIHKLFGNGGLNYLDLACGTGPHIEQFLHYGYRATGLDLNPAMLSQAQARCPSANYSQQNMSDYRFTEHFDLITCFLYSIHYCAPSSQFNAALTATYAALNSGGVFCFDTVDKHTIANDEGIKHSGTFEGAPICFQSGWHYSGESDTMALKLKIIRETEDSHQSLEDTHTMCAITINELKNTLIKTGFEVTLLERDFSRLIPWQGQTGNLLVACIKP